MFMAIKSVNDIESLDEDFIKTFGQFYLDNHGICN